MTSTPHHNSKYHSTSYNSMAENAKKRTLDAFFKPPPKKARVSDTGGQAQSGDSLEEHVSPVSCLLVQ